mgnify:CR=1 FL=1
MKKIILFSAFAIVTLVQISCKKDSSEIPTMPIDASLFLGEYSTVIVNNSNGYTTGSFTSTISAGENAAQFNVYPFLGLNINLKVNMLDPFGKNLKIASYTFSGTYLIEGTGSITNSGRTIVLNCTYSTYNYTSTYTR